MTKPPPTPSKPDKPPATTPDSASARAHGAVQMNLPLLDKRHGGGGRRTSTASTAGTQARRQMRYATNSSTAANNTASGRFGVRCASHSPSGEQTTPTPAISKAAL